MSYDKNTWAKGDVITANKLNHIEDGIENAGGGGGVLVCTENGTVLDHTWQEIHDADFAIVLATTEEDGNIVQYRDPIKTIFEQSDGYYVNSLVSDNIYGCSTANGYPDKDYDPEA